MEAKTRRAVVRSEVRSLLARSPAFQELPPDQQSRIAESTVVVAEAAAGDPLIDEVDFPSFVAGLIQGTFEAIVDASIQQMEAYGELMEDVAASVGEFASEALYPEAAAEWLKQHAIDSDSDRWSESVASLLLPAARARITRSRQKLLATMVLMGIQRIVESEGRPKVSRRRSPP